MGFFVRELAVTHQARSGCQRLEDARDDM